MMLTTCLLLLFLAVVPASAQNLLNTSSEEGKKIAERIDRAFAPPKPKNTLSCSARTLKPLLNFALRYQAGYRISFPLSQFPPEETDLRVILRITSSDSNSSRYFWQDLKIPATPRLKRSIGQTGGGFFLGEGNYLVDWLMIDDAGRKCQQKWKVKLRLKEQEREVVRFLKPGEVTPMVLDPWKDNPEGATRSHRIAIMLHASPMSPRAVKLNGFDRSILLSTLVSLLESGVFEECSVRAVSLQQQAQIFGTREFSGREYSALSDAMKGLELGTIDLEQLRNPHGHVDLLAQLVNQEITAEDPPGAIVFIGPNSRLTSKFPSERLESIPGQKPLFFYLNLDYHPKRFPFSDTIEKLVKSQKGKVFHIHHPRQFAEALLIMEEQLSESTG